MNSDQLISHARERFDHAASKRLLKEKYESKLLFAHAEGMWRAGPDLINILNCCSGDQAVILDLYENPVRINPAELKKLAEQRWQEQMNSWLTESIKLNQKR